MIRTLNGLHYLAPQLETVMLLGQCWQCRGIHNFILNMEARLWCIPF